jgi:uncharacterized surface protein with fasciclin (FAS1) repeats
MNKGIIIGIIALLAIVGIIFMVQGNREEVVVINNQNNTNMKNIVETAVEAGSFKTLVTAVQTARLVDALSETGPFTVFAPTDEAFAKLPAGTVESLLNDPAKLADILKYHVVSGKVMASDVVGLSSATTLLGQNVNIEVQNGSVKINDATVTATDIETSNGVIHVIDAVLLPE